MFYEVEGGVKEIREVKEILFSKFSKLLKFSTTHPHN